MIDAKLAAVAAALALPLGRDRASTDGAGATQRSYHVPSEPSRKGDPGTGRRDLRAGARQAACHRCGDSVSGKAMSAPFRLSLAVMTCMFVGGLIYHIAAAWMAM
jgi:hypothetical protein